jgi:hypothetical protein
MGNSESQQQGESTANAVSFEMRTCYYEILEVERSDATTSDDIKKVFRVLPIAKMRISLNINVVGLPTVGSKIPS